MQQKQQGKKKTFPSIYFVMRSLAHVKQLQDAGGVHLLGVRQTLLCGQQHLMGVNRWSYLQTHSSTVHSPDNTVPSETDNDATPGKKKKLKCSRAKMINKMLRVK